MSVCANLGPGVKRSREKWVAQSGKWCCCCIQNVQNAMHCSAHSNVLNGSRLEHRSDSSRIQLDTLGHTPTPSVTTSCLSRAATSASSQVNPIFRRSLLTTPLQFALGRPGPLLYLSTCQYSACCGMRLWSIRKTCPSQRSRLSLSMLSMVCCPVLALTSTLVILSFHEMPSILLHKSLRKKQDYPQSGQIRRHHFKRHWTALFF